MHVPYRIGTRSYIIDLHTYVLGIPQRLSLFILDFPAETARPERRNGDDMINGHAWLHQIGSALGELLRALKADGHDVDGALIQFHALRSLLITYRDALSWLWRESARVQDASLPWSPELPERLWKLKDW